MTIQPNDTPTDRLNKFLNFIWGDTDSIVYVASKTDTGKWKKSYNFWPANSAQIINYILVHTTDKDVYYGPAVYKNTPEVVAKLRANKPIEKQDILGSHVSWVEFDGNAPDEWATGANEAAGDPVQPLPEPSLRVQSSSPRHQHVYWRYKEFVTDVDFIERVNRIAAYSVKADTSGWDINQVLRPIETKNHKYKSDNSVIVYDQSNTDYPVATFSHFEPVKDYITEGIDTSDLPDPMEVMAKYTWTTDDTELINKSREQINDADRSGALMRIGYTCAEMQLSDAEAYALLLFCDDKWEKFKHRGDRKRRLVEIINRARQKYPHGIQDPTFAGLQPDSGVETEVKSQLIYGFRSLVQVDIKIEWMIKDLLPQRGLGMITSAPGRGKTQFALGLAMACALNKPMLGYQPVKPHKVLFPSLEMNLPSLKHFLDTMAKEYTEEEHEILERNLKLFPHGQPINLMLAESRKAFEAIVESERPQGLYIDSLQKIYLGDLSKDEIRGVYNYLTRIREKYNCYVFLIHHDRKAQEGNKRPRDLSDIYGSVYITAEPDCVLHLWQAEGKTSLELRELKNRLAPQRRMIHIARSQTLHFHQVEGEQTIEEKVATLNGLQPSSDGGSSSAFLAVE